MSVPAAGHLALIVEYDLWRRSILTSLMQELGFAVECASNGATGLRLARTLRPELVVLGVRLPELSTAQLVLDLEPLCRTTGMRVVLASADLQLAAAEIDSGSPQPIGASANPATGAVLACRRTRGALQKHPPRHAQDAPQAMASRQSG